MSDDMGDMMQKMSDMLKNNQIPDNVKEMLNNLASNSSNTSSSDASSSSSDSNSANNNFSFDDFFKNASSGNSQNDMPNFDVGMMLKMKSIMDSMNKEQNDPRANLLKSLKPYLKPSRKEKVEQYIKLFSMGKVFEMMGSFGGEKKNDV